MNWWQMDNQMCMRNSDSDSDNPLPFQYRQHAAAMLEPDTYPKSINGMKRIKIKVYEPNNTY